MFLFTGIVPTNGHFPMYDQELLTFGPMARYAEDLGLLMKVLTSKCDRDLRLNDPVDLKQLKVYYRFSMDEAFGVSSITSEMEGCVQRAMMHFTQYDIRPEKVFTAVLYTMYLFYTMCVIFDTVTVANRVADRSDRDYVGWMEESAYNIGGPQQS